MANRVPLSTISRSSSAIVAKAAADGGVLVLAGAGDLGAPRAFLVDGMDEAGEQAYMVETMLAQLLCAVDTGSS